MAFAQLIEILKVSSKANDSKIHNGEAAEGITQNLGCIDRRHVVSKQQGEYVTCCLYYVT